MATLEDLIVSGAELDRELVAQILVPFVRLDKDDASIRPIGEWLRLDAEGKILIYLLARKAMKALGFELPTDQEAAGPSEISEATGVKMGTVGPKVRDLLNRRVLAQPAGTKQYLVPNHAVEEIRAKFATQKR